MNDNLDAMLEAEHQAAMLTKALAGLVNAGTLALFAWTVAGIIALFTR